jgi:hypothetical protein
MEVLTFPQPMVNYLNALYAGLALEEAHQELGRHLQGTARWLKEQTPLLVGAEEELAANQLQALGRELAAALNWMQAGSYDAFEELCTDYSLALACFQRLRQRLRFVDFCEIDQLMQWVVAVSQGKAPRPALVPRLEEAVNLIDGLRLQMEACRELLPAPVCRPSTTGWVWWARASKKSARARATSAAACCCCAMAASCWPTSCVGAGRKRVGAVLSPTTRCGASSTAWPSKAANLIRGS